MDPSDVAFIKGAIAFVLVAGTGISVFWLRLRARRLGRPEVDRIVEALREENAALQAELGERMGELEERVDFVERRVVQPPRLEPLPRPEGRISTPV
jgi:hypothetical protein